MADIEVRMNSAEEKLIDHKGRLDELEGISNEHSEELERNRNWRDGIGASKGAEVRIQANEHKVGEVRESMQESMKDFIAESVKEFKAAIPKPPDKDKTIMGYIRAFAPWVAALAAVIVAILKG